MTSDTVTKRALPAGRIVLSVLGVLIGLTALAAFLEGSQLLHLEARWPALGRALEPLDEWRQISALLLVAWAIALQFMSPEKKFPERLAIRQGLEDADPRAEEKRPWGWMLLWSTGFVALWVGLLELLSRLPMSPEGRVLVLAGAVLVQSAAIFWLLRYAGKRQQRLIESHWAAEKMQCPRAVRALLSPSVGFLLGVGTLGLWVGLLLAVSGAWPQMIGLPSAIEGHTSLLAVMSLAADEVLDTVLFGIPAQYGLVLGQPQPHSWIGATILVVFRATIAVSLFFVLYHAIKARRTYASLIRRVLRESSQEASATLARIGWPTGRRLVREALRLRVPNGSDSTTPAARTLLVQAMSGFYHPRILEFARREAMNSEARDSDRVEALKYVCTYGDRQTALDLMGQFFHSENPDLREGVSLICVAFKHPDCNGFLEQIGRFPHTPGEYTNAVIGAGLRLEADLRDSDGLSACLEGLPSLLHAADGTTSQKLEGVSLLASFAAKEVKSEIQAAWPKMPDGTKLYCLRILLKIRAGLLPDPELLGRTLSNTESQSDKAGIGELWRFMTQAGVASLVEIARGPARLVRDEALKALSQLRASRTDLAIDAALLTDMMAPADESDTGSAEAEAPEAEAVPTEMSPDPETHLVSL
jgi:hypothetical protein